MGGGPAVPTDESLYATARRTVLEELPHFTPLTVKAALTEKKYRAIGGTFAFKQPLDTFIEGLHRRTLDLHNDWEKHGALGKKTRDAAIQEMLLRLRWDDSDDRARAKLSRIVGTIWDDLEKVDVNANPPSSALWLKDEGDIACLIDASSIVQ